MSESVTVTGIRLITVGAPGSLGEHIQVHAEVEGKWKCVIDELKDGPISHIVEPSGIKGAPVV